MAMAWRASAARACGPAEIASRNADGSATDHRGAERRKVDNEGKNAVTVRTGSIRRVSNLITPSRPAPTGAGGLKAAEHALSPLFRSAPLIVGMNSAIRRHSGRHAVAFFGVETRRARLPLSKPKRRFARRKKEEPSLMIHPIVSAPARPVGRTLAMLTGAMLTGALFAVFSAGTSLAQQPPAKQAPAAQPKQAPAAQPKQPAAKQAPQKGAPAQQAAAPADQQPQLIYSPWTKFCLKGQEANAKQVCFTGKDARLESGLPVVAAVLIEPEGEQKKVLRVTLPLGMQLVHGTRTIIDQSQPAQAPYVICFTNGCMADYEANADMIGKLKKGQQLAVQAINSNGQAISLSLPLSDFAKAYDGPPTDPKVFEEQQKKLQDELQRRANEARQKLENQQGQPPTKTQ
jgi:invasion protein IalB